MVKEIQMLNASGADVKNSNRYNELTFRVADQEAELEQRDFTNECKSVIPINIRHYDHGCIGPTSCHK